MWLAASILEAEAMHLPGIEAGEAEEPIKAKEAIKAEGEMTHEKTSPAETGPAEMADGAMAPMAHGEWLAHMAAAEYGEMPDHMPSVW